MILVSDCSRSYSKLFFFSVHGVALAFYLIKVMKQTVVILFTLFINCDQRNDYHRQIFLTFESLLAYSLQALHCDCVRSK